ncbi:hypothetical protein NIES4075_09760 [Tolypothrix sp. NIES-4075]|nr:hypothetical protein NIES4075_09760 [Tolypothrix sp. NIES-4075]
MIYVRMGRGGEQGGRGAGEAGGAGEQGGRGAGGEIIGFVQTRLIASLLCTDTINRVSTRRQLGHYNLLQLKHHRFHLGR